MLITEQYRKQQEKLHENPNYGVASESYAPMVTSIINSLGISELLDYGAGKGNLGKNLAPSHRLVIDHYDPAVPDWSEPPEPRQMVACIDVLEHIEPDLIDNVLDDLKRCVLQYGFFSIHTGPAVKILDDGRNAHLIQEDFRWWLPKIWSRFDIMAFNEQRNGFYVIVRVKDEPSRLQRVESVDSNLVKT